MSKLIDWDVPGLDNVTRVAEVGEHENLIISPTLNKFHLFELQLRGRENPLKENLPPAVAIALGRVDFRNLPEVNGKLPWQICFSVSGPEFDDNPLDLLAPSAFLTAAFNPEGHELTQRELVDIGDAIGMDMDISFVRVQTSLLSPKRMQAIADQSVLPNQEPATGLLIRPEERPALALRLRNHNYRKEHNAKKQKLTTL